MPESRRKLAANAWGALLQVHASLVPSFDRLLRAETGLPLAWYDVLLELANAPDRRLTMGELGQRVVLSRSRASRVVDEMAAAGLVGREANPADARSAYAVLTAAGRERFHAAAPVYLRAIERTFGGPLGTDDLARLEELLNRVRSAASSGDRVVGRSGPLVRPVH